MIYSYTIIIAFLCGIILYKIFTTHPGRLPFIRKIPGLDTIDEAVGRATEMGKPIFFSPGLTELDISSLSALMILSRVSRLAARYNTRVISTIPSYMAYVMAEEICREAYVSEGKGELFDPSRDLHLIINQFPYAIGSAGIMHREKVAAVFLFGYFFAESLILAEAGNTVGAIQVAGSDSILQLPFFVVTCDYTIIGEELYAAGAYISKHPTMLASLVAQDRCKVLISIFVIIGSIFATLSAKVGYNIILDLFGK
jgi:hypothetical protein